MKLSIISEGFRYENGMSLDDFRQAAEKYKQADVKRSDDNPVKLLRKGGKFVFYNEDSQNDFLFIEPVFESASIPIKASDKNALSTFEGAQIMYGFKIRDPSPSEDTEEDTEEQVTDSEGYFGQYETPDPIKPIVNVAFQPLENELNELAEQLSHPPGSDFIRPTIAKSYKPGNKKRYVKFVKFVSDWLVAIDRDKRGVLNLDIEEYKPAVVRMKDILLLLQDENLAKQGEQDVSLYQNRQIDRKEEQTIRNEYTAKLQFAFAKALKDPNNEDEEKVRDNFIEMSVLLFDDKVGSDYDILLYPQSGGKTRQSRKDWASFNKRFAEKLANQIGIPFGVHEITKVHPDDVNINRIELIRRAKMLGRREEFKVDKGSGRMWKIKPDDPKWPEWWATKEENKIRSVLGGTADIKNVSMADKRRYAQLFQLVTGGAEPKVLADKNILIVDDNVHHQGTMEMLHALVQVAKPKSIGLFTPFLLRGFW